MGFGVSVCGEGRAGGGGDPTALSNGQKRVRKGCILKSSGYFIKRFIKRIHCSTLSDPTRTTCAPIEDNPDIKPTISVFVLICSIILQDRFCCC